MAEATGNAREALAEAVAKGDRVQVRTLAAALVRDGAPDVPEGAVSELLHALGAVLAEAGAIDEAFAAHVRALESLPRDAPDPHLVLREIDALIALAEARGDLALAIELQMIARNLTRACEGADSPAYAARLAHLDQLRLKQSSTRPGVAAAAAAPAAAAAAEARGLEGISAAPARQRVTAPSPDVLASGFALERAKAAEAYQKVDVLFATSRRPTGSANPYTYFSGQRHEGAGGTVHSYGIAEVSIPKKRTVGSLPTPSWFQQRPGFHSDDLYLLKQIRELSQADWDRQLAAGIAARDKHEALVYVHGYNVSFWQAMVRAAQLHADLDIDGMVAAYSWPSRGSIFYYQSDRQEIIEPHVAELKRIIAMIARIGDVGRITVVAHSMGCEFLLAALHRLQLELANAPGQKMPLIKDVIFAAPDVDVTPFTSIVSQIAPLADRVSVYTSENDVALSFGRWLMSVYDRAGSQPAKVATMLAGKAGTIDTIDTTEASGGFLGHSDFSTSAIDDLRAVVWLSLMPERRPTLIQRWAGNGGPGFWVYRNASASTERETYRQALQLCRQCGGVTQALAALQGGMVGIAETVTAARDELTQALRKLA